MPKPQTKTTTKPRYRVLAKHKTAKRYSQIKDWYGLPLEFKTRTQAKAFVQKKLEDPRWANRYDFRTEAQVIRTTTTIEPWQSASSGEIALLEAELWGTTK